MAIQTSSVPVIHFMGNSLSKETRVAVTRSAEARWRQTRDRGAFCKEIQHLLYLQGYKSKVEVLHIPEVKIEVDVLHNSVVQTEEEDLVLILVDTRSRFSPQRFRSLGRHLIKLATIGGSLLLVLLREWQ